MQSGERWLERGERLLEESALRPTSDKPPTAHKSVGAVSIVRASAVPGFPDGGSPDC
jgi:hypothetical protein